MLAHHLYIILYCLCKISTSVTSFTPFFYKQNFWVSRVGARVVCRRVSPWGEKGDTVHSPPCLSRGKKGGMVCSPAFLPWGGSEGAAHSPPDPVGRSTTRPVGDGGDELWSSLHKGREGFEPMVSPSVRSRKTPKCITQPTGPRGPIYYNVKLALSPYCVPANIY